MKSSSLNHHCSHWHGNASPHHLLPPVSRDRLLMIGVGWVLVAAVEVTAYTVLAWAIAESRSPMMVLIFALLAIGVTIGVSRAGYLCGAQLAGNLYDTLGEALARAKLSWFSAEHRAEVTLLAGQGIPGFMSIPAHHLQTLLHAPLIPLLLMIGMAIIAGGQVMLGAIVLLTLALITQYLAQSALQKADAKRHIHDRRTAQLTQEFTEHLPLLRTSMGPQGASERLEQQWTHQARSIQETHFKASVMTFIAASASALPLVGFAFYLTFMSISDPALWAALLILMTRATAPLEAIALTGLGLNDLRASLKDLQKITEAPTLSMPPPAAAQTPSGHTITLAQVMHQGLQREITLTIPEGERLIVTGPTGSGKSTLLELLMRFDDPDQGSITLGGIALAQMTEQTLTDHMAYVGQEAIMFTGTLADNIRIGDPDASDNDIKRAAQSAALGRLLAQDSRGIHQPVGYQGSALSGGERQRLAIARALIKQAPILILDEATSALDQETEAEIAQMLSQQPATLIIVTHGETEIWRPTQTVSLGTT